MDFICKHCLQVFKGVEAAHHLSTHLMQHHKGVSEPPGGIPIERKANPMHLRDVAMNQIGVWIGQDVMATYETWTYGREHPEHLAYFEVYGKVFCLTVREV